jgi:hypothetical protein
MTGKHDTLDLDLSGIRVSLKGPRDGSLDLFRDEWASWIGSPEGSPDLVFEYSVSGEPPSDQAVLRKVLHTGHGGGRTSFTTGEGRVDLDSHGRATAVVRRGGDRFRFYGLQNLLLAALATVLPGHGVLLVHGAGILLEGVAVALIGPEGAGKSTWSRIAREAGTPVLSDDLLLLGLDGDQAIALGCPFRDGGNGPGRWPLGMLLSARHASRPELLPANRLAIQGLMLANLPFSGDRVGIDPRLDRMLDMLLETVPFGTLAFAPEPSFLPVLVNALAGRSQG